MNLRETTQRAVEHYGQPPDDPASHAQLRADRESRNVRFQRVGTRYVAQNPHRLTARQLLAATRYAAREASNALKRRGYAVSRDQRAEVASELAAAVLDDGQPPMRDAVCRKYLRERAQGLILDAWRAAHHETLAWEGLHAAVERQPESDYLLGDVADHAYVTGDGDPANAALRRAARKLDPFGGNIEAAVLRACQHAVPAPAWCAHYGVSRSAWRNRVSRGLRELQRHGEHDVRAAIREADTEAHSASADALELSVDDALREAAELEHLIATAPERHA